MADELKLHMQSFDVAYVGLSTIIHVLEDDIEGESVSGFVVQWPDVDAAGLLTLVLEIMRRHTATPVVWHVLVIALHCYCRFFRGATSRCRPWRQPL